MLDTTIDLTADVIDVRDIIARIEELAGAEDEASEDYLERAGLESIMADLKGMGGDEKWRGDWYPSLLIDETYFEEYARELADDLYGDEMRGTHWPFSYIDWEAAAVALQQDYSSVEVDGRTYWTR